MKPPTTKALSQIAPIPAVIKIRRVSAPGCPVLKTCAAAMQSATATPIEGAPYAALVTHAIQPIWNAK
jgi:hypothetical protein